MSDFPRAVGTFPTQILNASSKVEACAYFTLEISAKSAVVYTNRAWFLRERKNVEGFEETHARRPGGSEWVKRCW